MILFIIFCGEESEARARFSPQKKLSIYSGGPFFRWRAMASFVATSTSFILAESWGGTGMWR